MKIQFTAGMTPFLALTVLSSVVAGCTVPVKSVESVEALSALGLERVNLAQTVVGYFQPDKSVRTLTVFIESDGARWRSKLDPPASPTPSKSVVIALVREESRLGPVAYLGRPCQYANKVRNLSCDKFIWAEGRFGLEAVLLMDESISKLVSLVGAERINLVGHSGGGVIAMLVAARRTDINCVVTLASPLQLKRWTQIMNVEEMPLSIDPEDQADLTRYIPQSHFVGSEDTVVPPVAFDFDNDKKIFATQVLIGFNHYRPWAAKWRSIRSESCLSVRGSVKLDV